MSTLTSITRPSAEGTFTLPAIDAQYSIGRDHVRDTAAFLARNTTPLTVDIETEGFGRAAMNVKAVVVGSATHAAVLDPRDPQQAEMIRYALTTAHELLFHNTSFDVPILVRSGLMQHSNISKVRDLLLYCRLAEPDERTSKSLSEVSKRYLKTQGTDLMEVARKAAGIRSKKQGFIELDLDDPLYVQGAAIDVFVTARALSPARQAAHDRLTSGHPFPRWGVTGVEAERLLEREQIINRMLLRRSARGLRVDPEYIDHYLDGVKADQVRYRALLIDHGVQPGRASSLIEWLHGHSLIPEGYPLTPKQQLPSTRKDDLALINHPIARAYVQLKETEKIEADYLDKTITLSQDWRIHPTASLLAASTGRMSMSDPPLQQFPEEARGIILADKGDSLTSIDWSQIEPVVAANVAKDHELLKGYEEGTSDVYSTIAQIAGINRKEAKVVVLAQLYGQGITKLALQLSVTQDEARQLRAAVFDAMPKVKRLVYKLRDIAQQYQMIFTLSGRILPVPSGSWGIAVHKGVNYFVQGGAYDVLAESLLKVEEAGLGDALYLTMHDELVVSTEVAADVERIMRTPPERLCELAGRTPVLHTDRVDLGERWGTA